MKFFYYLIITFCFCQVGWTAASDDASEKSALQVRKDNYHQQITTFFRERETPLVVLEKIETIQKENEKLQLFMDNPLVPQQAKDLSRKIESSWVLVASLKEELDHYINNLVEKVASESQKKDLSQEEISHFCLADVSYLSILRQWNAQKDKISLDYCACALAFLKDYLRLLGKKV